MFMREYKSDDLDAVMALADQAWQPIRKMSREALGDFISDLLNPAGDAKSKGLQVKEQIDSGLYRIAVCEHENQIAGFITYRINGDAAEICNNAADGTLNLKGIGQMMYRYALDDCKKAKAKFVKVTTGLDPAHAPARRAYERAGFKKHLDSVTYFMELE